MKKPASSKPSAKGDIHAARYFFLIMELRRAYLLGVHPTSAAKFSPEAIANADSSIDVLFYLPEGLVWGGSLLIDASNSVPESWKDILEHCYIQASPDRLGPFKFNLSIAAIKPNEVAHLAKLKDNFPKRVNELYNGLFPPERSPRHSGGHVFPSILLCQPSANEMRLTRETFASEAVALMGFEACAVLPAMLEGTLFVAGPYSALEYESVGAFTQSNPPFDDRICVPAATKSPIASSTTASMRNQRMT